MENRIETYDDFVFHKRAFQELDKRWQNGKLERHVERLNHFIRQNFTFIKTSLGERTSEEDICKTVDSCFRTAGTFDPLTDMEDQVEEIRREIWIRGQAGPHNPHEIQIEWTHRWADLWRHWRVMECMYVIDKKAAEIFQDLSSHRDSP